MTGSLPVAIYEIVTALPGDQHWWHHPPSWVIWLSVVLALSAAQYRAWRDVRNERESIRGELAIANARILVLEGKAPEIDERLELLEEAPRLTIPDDAMTRRLEELLPTEPYPDHSVSARFRTRAAIDPAILTVQCTAPIYRVIQFYCEAGETEPIMVLPRIGYRQSRQDLIVATFKDGPLAAGSRFLIKIFSPTPIALRRVSVGPTRPPAPPAGPPSPKASG